MTQPELPPGWMWTTLGEISRINYRDPILRDLSDDFPVTFLPMAGVDADTGKIVEPQERPISEVRKGFTSFSEGDVLFAKITPSMENGKAAIAKGLKNRRGFGSTEFHVLSPNDNILPEWIFYFIRQESFRGDAKANFAGTAGQLRVPTDFLKDYPFPLPPLAEQHRIVDEIEAQFTRLDAVVAALKRAQANLKRYRASVLKTACEGRLVPQDPSDEPAGQLLARILAERRKQWNGRGPYTEPTPPDTTGLPELPVSWVWATMEMLTVFGPQNGLYLPKSKYGAGVPILRIDNYQNNCGKYSRPPPPLAEQQRIVEEVERRLSVMDEVEAALAANLKRAERLRQAVLKRAFEGKLVPQNPADESAAALLARIREAKAEAKGSRQMGLPGV